MSDYAVEVWLTREELEAEDFSGYWNDPAIENEKSLERDRTMLQELQNALPYLVGTGADLGCGNMWAIPYLAAKSAIEHIYAVEYSRYRLFERGKAFLESQGVPDEKVTLCLGSFYECDIFRGSLDWVLLAGSFHHARHPELLLREVKRILKPDGRLVMIGEHPVTWVERWQALKHGYNPLARQVVIDAELGDHGYTKREYRRMLMKAGFAERGKGLYWR